MVGRYGEKETVVQPRLWTTARPPDTEGTCLEGPGSIRPLYGRPAASSRQKASDIPRWGANVARIAMRKAVTPYVTTNKQHPATAVSTESEAHGQKSARPPMVHQAGTCRRSTGPVRSSIATRPNPLPMKIVCCQLSKARRRNRVPERVSNFV